MGRKTIQAMAMGWLGFATRDDQLQQASGEHPK